MNCENIGRFALRRLYECVGIAWQQGRGSILAVRYSSDQAFTLTGSPRTQIEAMAYGYLAL